MKKWERSSPELIARFDACLPKAAGVERRQMFGCPCAFVNGNMFTGVHEQRLIVRLPEKQRAALSKEPDAKPFVVMGRTMREYVAFERPLERTPREIGAWMKKALDYALALPPKSKKSRTTVVRALPRRLGQRRARGR
jgi:TfoX/Sxy family transcriptional regulator of competence genes